MHTMLLEHGHPYYSLHLLWILTRTSMLCPFLKKNNTLNTINVTCISWVQGHLLEFQQPTVGQRKFALKNTDSPPLPPSLPPQPPPPQAVPQRNGTL